MKPSIQRVAYRHLRSMEFPTQEALKRYLEEHPGADKANHSVAESGGDAKPKGKAPKSKKKGGHDLISGAGGHEVILSSGTKQHITGTHTKPGKGSIFNPDVSVEAIQDAVSDIPESFFKKGGGAYELTVPHAGYDLVHRTSDILKKYPNAKKVTVEKEERGKIVEVTGYIVDNDIEDFSTDTMTVVARPTTDASRQYLPEDLQKDEDVDEAIKGGRAFSVLTAWAGKSDVPPASQWGEDYAVIIPNEGKGADMKAPKKEASIQRVAYQHLLQAARREALNKYDPGELLTQLVTILEKYDLKDVVKEVKALTPKIQKAWRERETESA